MVASIQLGGIIESRDLIMVIVQSAPDLPGTAGKILKTLGENDINVEFISEGINIDLCADVSICFKKELKDKVTELFRNIGHLVQQKNVKWYNDIGIISFYGPHFREKPMVAGKICTVLGDADINIIGMATSISTVSCVISNSEMDKATEAIKAEFEMPE